jgi:hypothetical protein
MRESAQRGLEHGQRDRERRLALALDRVRGGRRLLCLGDLFVDDRLLRLDHRFFLRFHLQTT